MEEKYIKEGETYWTKKHSLKGNYNKKSTRFTVKKIKNKDKDEPTRFYNKKGKYVVGGDLAPVKCTDDCDNCKWKNEDRDVPKVEQSLYTSIENIRKKYESVSSNKFRVHLGNVISRLERKRTI